MARVFRQQYTQRLPDGERVTRQSAKWYVEFCDAQRIRRRVPGYTDKAATQQLASELERSAAREQSGLVDRFAVHRKRPLAEHLTDWRASLLAKGVTEKHAELTVRRATRVFDECRFSYLPDLSASKVQASVRALQEGGLSAQSCVFYMQAAKQFCRWCVRDGRAADHPLSHLPSINVRTDRRHDRRALAAQELQLLLDATRIGPERFGMDPESRATLYQLAVETGLRASELRSLTWGCVDLQADPPTVTVRVAYSKHRRDDTLPLKASTAQLLARWRDENVGADTEHPVFANMPRKDAIAKMFRADLADARAAWIASAGTATGRNQREETDYLDYRDSAGRVADFQCLRHSFISNLARGGVHPKIAQQLARPSTITLTMDRYSHTVLGVLSDALSALPELTTTGRERESEKATGTYDSVPSPLPICLPLS